MRFLFAASSAALFLFTAAPRAHADEPATPLDEVLRHGEDPEAPAPSPDPAPTPTPAPERHAPKRPAPPPPPAYNYDVPPPDTGSRGARLGLTLSGTIVGGLGAGTLVAAGVCWLVAWADSRHLEDECPNQRCVEGERGARSLETARDTADAAEILVAIGAPAATVGLSLVIAGATLPGHAGAERPVHFALGPGGASLAVAWP
jgi:hypothetical protein